MRTRSLLCTLAVAALATVAATAQDQSFSLKPTFKKGDVLAYKMKAQFDYNDTVVLFNAKFTQKVVALDEKSGDYSLEQAQTDPHVTDKDGKELMEVPDSPAVTTKFKASGAVDELAASDANLTSDKAYRLAILEVISVPANPVKVGDTWNFKADKVANKWMKTNIDYKVEGLETVGNVDCVKISFDAKEVEGEDAASEKGTAWLSKSDFTLVKREAKVNNLPIPAAPAPLSGTITYERVESTPTPPPPAAPAG